ncbi:adenosylcobinamide-GDP ribazoletransferase [Bosea sp. (in: a-proteobacteria)]|uniref:adenosylcobinamide-GDP ribazoletransferase n=1 Tax=Bosea sp. (in: a-proteobacteria) TaxID=1871050 RepID=UPI0027375869|nr:adenosylcobinamide-GDP ribazoletransferase [Bosea sp. (in: a-proteobacteria)]MDP3256039.1 adenosylcobinamide-GDP ribazoletransferase [Bosea sp. (in: a-proteobacteria)]
MKTIEDRDAAPPQAAPLPPVGAAPVWPGWIVATAICVRFYSRLPIPALPGEADPHAAPDFRTVPRALPFAALVIALPGALVLVAAGGAGFGGLLSATLAVATLAVTTGALHEDGLADSADGLFGGRTPERRLEIMKDSRLGSYGALAMALALLLRVFALALILDRAGPLPAAGAFVVVAVLSRLSGLHLLAGMAPARAAGASAAVGRPSLRTAWLASGIGLLLAGGLALTFRLPLAGLGLGLMLLALNALLVRRQCRRLIGGQTGDIAGATQQLDEIVLYLGFALMLGAGLP